MWICRGIASTLKMGEIVKFGGVILSRAGLDCLCSIYIFICRVFSRKIPFENMTTISSVTIKGILTFLKNITFPRAYVYHIFVHIFSVLQLICSIMYIMQHILFINANTLFEQQGIVCMCTLWKLFADCNIYIVLQFLL